MKSSAAEERVILQARLDNKGYLKRRIDNLQDEARKIRFKIFESQENNNSKEERFFNSELTAMENEITKFQTELRE